MPWVVQTKLDSVGSNYLQRRPMTSPNSSCHATNGRDHGLTTSGNLNIHSTLQARHHKRGQCLTPEETGGSSAERQTALTQQVPAYLVEQRRAEAMHPGRLNGRNPEPVDPNHHGYLNFAEA